MTDQAPGVSSGKRATDMKEALEEDRREASAIEERGTEFPRRYYLPMDCPLCGRRRLLYGTNQEGDVVHIECEKCGANSEDETLLPRDAGGHA